ncbi:uncharacterized protein BXIN_2923 [Babesia sp. Xinjiang]|uniref:uncharacterized protein n=1 Tax=Babesia sp. Xinjiang TaxID=462227 RepID=UPI000A23D215|nr:uncharacterized protein BXIN_2923 [Babesia sp. Xinjiang]ORM39541.1 hypothetical protein BXIN_2923 [Babesia sp. Xinjiang]
MARSRLRGDSHHRPRRKSRPVEDEEISEDEAFTEEDELKYGRFFQSKRPQASEETGELWDCLIEDAADDYTTEESTTTKAASQSVPSKVDAKALALDDSYDEFTRLEESADLITEDSSGAGLAGFEWISQSAEGDSKYASLINRFREIHEDLPEVFREESRAKTSREERKELYESLKKDATKRWEPVVQHLKRQKHLTYGESGGRSDPTCGSMTQMKAETDLEKELEEHSNVAYERALHARELRKQKRVNRIKSKNWHKRQKKRDLELYAKLIEKSNDPELTKELLESFEQKRSKHRVLRKRAAQEKWAKLAMRFGDRSVLKQISSAQQQLKDDLSLIKETIDGAAEKESSDSEDSGASSSESEDGSDPGDPQDDVLAKLQIISNPVEGSIPQKGLFALKFMKESLQSKIAKQGETGSDATTAVALGDKLEDDYEEESIASDSDDDYEPVAALKDFQDTKVALPKVSDAELKRAMQEIQHAFGIGNDYGTASNSGVTVPGSVTTMSSVDVAPKDRAPLARDASSKSETENITDDSKDVSEKKQASAASHIGVGKHLPTVSENAILTEDTGLENFIKNLGPVKKPNSTIELAQRLFVTRPEEEAYLSDDEDSEAEDGASDQLKGWGSWTGFGIVDVKAPKTNAAESKKKKSRVKVSNKKDPKLDKYLLHRVPHPYKTKHDYNAKMATVVGPEWNTVKMHTELVQPKTSIKVGSVVKPLSSESAKDYVKRMGKAFHKNPAVALPGMRRRLTKSIPPWELYSRQAYKRRRALAASGAFPRPELHALFNRCKNVLSGSNTVLNGPRRLPYEAGTLNGVTDGHSEGAEGDTSVGVVSKGHGNDAIAGNAFTTSDATFPTDPEPVLDDLNLRLQYLGYYGQSRHDKRLVVGFVHSVAPFVTAPEQVLKLLCSLSCVVNVRCLLSTSTSDTNIKLSCREPFESLFRRLDDSVSAYHAVTCYLKLSTFYGQDVSELSPVYHIMVDKLVSGDIFITERELDDLLFVYQRLAVCDRRILTYCSDRISQHFDCFSDNEVCNFARYLVNSVHARRKRREIGAGVDYSHEFETSEATALLDGFEVNSSAFLHCLESNMPIYLHQYSYFNLVDLGEFYHVFNIQSDVRVRFSTELWKYLYTLRYGYPIKALVVLSKLGLAERKTFGRLIRNIPHTLAFRWPLSLVSECLVSLDWAKNAKVYVVLAHYLSKSISASFSASNVARVFESLRNKRIVLLGLYQKVLRIQSANPGWLGCDELLSIASYGQDVGFNVDNAFELLIAQGISGMGFRQAIKTLYVMDTPYPDLVDKCITVINDNCNTELLDFRSLMELLVSCRRLNIWLCVVPKLALDTLLSVETIELPVLLELLDLLAVGGPLSDADLLRRLETYVCRSIEELPLRTTGKILWLCSSLGVLGASLQRLESHNQDMRIFLRNLSRFKDISWRRESAEVQKIRAFQNTLGCKAFVSVFPFTADIEVSTSVLTDYVDRLGSHGVALPASGALSLSHSLAPCATEDTILLDLCGKPFITVVDSNGRKQQSLRFYYKLRSGLVDRPFVHLLEPVSD